MRSSQRKASRKTKPSKTAKRAYKRVGYCAIDSGQLLITDPAYVNQFKFDAGENRMELSKLGKGFQYSYSGCMAATMSRKMAGQLLGRTSQTSGSFYHAGVAVDPGFGDGLYPVYVEYEDGMIKSVTVRFFE